jgi:branched-chain amino acid transport system ATP-binding protein
VTHLLELDGVSSGYGRVRILDNLSLSVPEGAVAVLVGPNGAGKTTTLRTIAGLLPLSSGSIRLDGRRLDGRRPKAIARSGVILVPEGRGVFPSLSVRENLEVAVRADRSADRATRRDEIDRVLDAFPRLRERLDQLAGTMSGGEQQMLAMSRGLLAKPRLMLIDELSMGLAPLIVEQLYETVAALKAQHQTILLVEQYLTHALRVADVCYVLGKGRLSFVGDPGELSDSSTLSELYLGAH